MAALTSRRGITVAIVIATAVAMTAFVIVLTAGPATAKQFATLNVLTGTVEVQRGADGFQPGADNQTLREGDTVRTGPDGRASIEYFDGSATRLDYDTTFTIKSLESVPDEPGSKIIVGKQEEGTSFNRVVSLTGSDSRFETETPTATASVRGTAYVVKVRPDGSTEYWIIEGTVALTTPDGEEVLLRAGEGIVIEEDGTVGQRFRLTDEQLNDGFVELNQCVLDGVEDCVEGVVTTPSPTPTESPTPQPSPTDTGAGPIDDPAGPDTNEGDAGNDAAADTTPPETLLTEGPSGTTTGKTSTFRFSSNESGSTFTCSVDGGAFAPCTSPRSVGPLGDGTHTFAVRARDNAGNSDPTPASRSWTIDSTPPETTITSGPGGGDVVARSTGAGAPQNSPTATFAFASSEPGSTFECSINGVTFSSCGPPFTTPALSHGNHRFEVRAIDAAGNSDPSPAQRDWEIDLEAPETTITSAPDGTVDTTTAELHFESNETGSTFECDLDEGGFVPCSSPETYDELDEGTHTFAVRATDSAGNTDTTPDTASWTVDTAAPDTTIDSGPGGTVSSTSAQFTFSSTESGSTFECKLDGENYTSCESPKTYSDLAEGQHTFSVRATDPGGNTDDSPATRTWTINLGPPETTITSAPDPFVDETETTATFEFESSEANSTFECSLDSVNNGQYHSCSSPKTYTGLPVGIRTFQVRATDAQGVTDPSAAQHSWRIGTPDTISIALSWSGGPSDLDLQAWTPQGDRVYYGSQHRGSANCTANERTGCWISLDRDITNGPPGSETITINPGASGFLSGTYRIEVINFSCNGTFTASNASVTIFGGGVNQTFQVGASILKKWNVASVSITSGGAATVSALSPVHEGDPCGVVARQAVASRTASGAPEPAPSVEEFTTDARSLQAEVDGETVTADWRPLGEGEIRYSTEAFVEALDEGDLACRGTGECEFQVPEGAERLFLTLFRDGEEEIVAVEDVNAVRVDLGDESEGSNGDQSGGGGGEPQDVPPTTPPEEDEPGTPPEEDADPEPEPEPEPSPTPTETPSEGETPAA